MKTEEKMVFKLLKRIIFISLVIISFLGIGVLASNLQYNTVTIEFPENGSIEVLTNKNKVSDILNENHIILLEDENVFPELDSLIDNTRKISIVKKSKERIIIAEETSDVSVKEILGKYVTVVEKIVVEHEEIPFETITKDVSNSEDTFDKIVKIGQNGLREVKYKIKYQDDVEIEKTELSSEIIKEPIDQIVEVTSSIVSRSGSREIAANASNILASKVIGIEPQIVNMNTSAYCACVKCCGKTNGITSSGELATSWYTVAAGRGYPIGTIIYVPSLSNQINGGWFIVQDRGGAIKNNKMDIFLDTHQEALVFGRRTLECYVYIP